MAAKPVFMGFFAICFMGEQYAYSGKSRHEIAAKSSRGVVMFIVPLTSSITPMETMSQKKQTESTDDGEATFFDVFESLVKNVKETDAQVQKDSVDLMLGDVDDLAQIQVNLEKAATAVDLLVTVKNKAVDAYNEIMRMTV